MCSSEPCYSSRMIGVVLLASLPFARSLNISSLNGEVTFDLKMPPYRNSFGDRAKMDKAESEKMVLRVVRKNVTVAPLVECQYQYPEREQIDAILSNMMNELTKVYVKSQQFVLGEEKWTMGRRVQNTRFKVVNKKDTNFFETIYRTMTTEYIELYNSTKEHVSRAGRDPCTNQPLIRQMWRDILDNSLAMLRSASRATIKEHKRIHNRTEPSSSRIDQFLSRQGAKVKASQLDLLCYKFQLCFNDLL